MFQNLLSLRKLGLGENTLRSKVCIPAGQGVSILFRSGKSNRVPKRSRLTHGDMPLDPEVLSEVLGCLEDMQLPVIASRPRLAESVMSDAALIIRALADKADIDI